MLALTATFWALVLPLLGTRRGREALRARTAGEWGMDLAGLLVQGTLVPLMGTALAWGLWSRLLPGGGLPVGVVGGFLVNVVLVDYLYYWNHRLLHRWWPIHAVHHTAPTMDVLVTSRNTLWASLAIVYVWVNGLFLHLVDDPRGYAAGVTLTAALDLWRHSPWQVAVPGLIQPRDHAWHHATERHDVNFGANWTWWDRLHGTFHRPGPAPERLGVPVALPLWRQLLWPLP